MRGSEAHEGYLFESVWVHYWRFYPDGRWTRCVSQDVELPFWALTERDGAGAKETFTSGMFHVTEAGSLAIREPSMMSGAQTSLREYRWTIEDDRLLPEPSGLPDHVGLSFVPSAPAQASHDPRPASSVATTPRVEAPAPLPSPCAMPVASSPVFKRSQPHRPELQPVPSTIVPAGPPPPADAGTDTTSIGQSPTTLRRSVPVVDPDRVRDEVPPKAPTAPSANAVRPVPSRVGPREPFPAADKVAQAGRTRPPASTSSTLPQSAPAPVPRPTGEVPLPVIRTAPLADDKATFPATPEPRPGPKLPSITIRPLTPPVERCVPTRAAETAPSLMPLPGTRPVPISSPPAEAGPAPARAGRVEPQLSASREFRVEQDVAATRPRNRLGGWAISLSAVPLMLLWAHTVATALRSAFEGADAAPRMLAVAQGLAGVVGWACLLWLAWNPPLQDKPHLRPIYAWLWLGVASMFLSPQMILLGPPSFLLAAIVLGRRPNQVRRRSSWKRPLFALEATAAAVPCALAVIGGLPTAVLASAFAMPDGAPDAGLPGPLVALAVGWALQQYVVLVVNTIAGTVYRFGWWSWLALPGVGLAIQIAMDAWRDDDAGRFAAGAPILLVTLHFVLLQPWRARRDRAGRPRLQPVS